MVLHFSFINNTVLEGQIGQTTPQSPGTRKVNDMTLQKIIQIPFNDMTAVYIITEENQVGFSMVPKNNGLHNLTFDKGTIHPLVQISITGDASSLGFAAGESRHNSALTMSMKYVSQEVTDCENGMKRVTTVLRNSDGITVEHILEGDTFFDVYTRVINNSSEDIMIEAISSFCLTGITPYTENTGRDRLIMHRFRSYWSSEGRHEARPVEDMLLEPSWANFSVRCEKFGTLGSMPVRGFFPFVAIEDKEEGVFWGATLEGYTSWQIEPVRINDNLVLSGGLADYEYGHFRKSLKRGESFTTPESYLTTVKGNLDDVCDRLLDALRAKLTASQHKTSLPAVFNEYCTTWGEPSEEKIDDILKVINGKDFEYFVIDAGWYADAIRGWQDNMGDWNVAENLFPNGIKSAVQKINNAGMKAGIWFELEVVGKDADVVNDTAHLLTRDGKVIISGTRRFWDMRSEWVQNYLTKKVIDFLNENGFEYIKIDYNDTIGIGCDGAESPGEGLRQCMEATRAFYRKIKECVPGIAIEVCSSGGHRLSPGFMELADFLSFSDAHEEKEIPVIALDLHRLILASKSQIWAVLRKTDPLKRIAYSVCAGMYGVLCISGDVSDLTDEQWNLAREGVTFYKSVSGIIADGFTKRFGPFQTSNRALKGYQAAVRYGKNDEALVIVHSFAGVNDASADGTICIPLEGDFAIASKYEASDHNVRIEDNCIKVHFENDFDAAAIYLKKK